ncbi:MAG: hypothetical protein ACRDZ3_20840 [Acidimicrobiia bacterium]
MSLTPIPIGPGPDVPAVGALAEAGQYQRARAAFRTALLAAPVQDVTLSGRPARYTSADLRSPQHFVSHPEIRYAVDPTTVGLEVAMPHLPGRPTPAGWDGEPGASSPIGGA